MRNNPVPVWVVWSLAIAACTAVYFPALTAPFLNDDYLFLEQARSQPLFDSLRHLGALGNYYRPLSRQIYFEILTPVLGGHPLVFHLVNYAVFLGALVLLADLLRALLPRAGVVAGLVVFALLPMHGVNLTWVSCSQDLLALTGVLGAVALHRRGRPGLALLPALAAFASKETALALPAALLAWELLIARRRFAHAVRGAWPCAAPAVGWATLAFAMRRQNPAAAPLHLDASHVAAGYAHLLQSMFGIEHGPGFVAALAASGPPPLPLLLLLPLTLLLVRAPLVLGVPGALRLVPPPLAPADALQVIGMRRVLAFAAAWIVAFGLPAGPVAYSWSSYYYTVAAVGGAVLAGAALRHAGPIAAMIAIAAMLWLNAAGAQVRAFAVADQPWVWTSHLTRHYFDRAGMLGDVLSRDLERLEPSPPPSARLFFSNLPSFAGFQMGNGARIRSLYRRDDLQSHFYSTFSDSTAGNQPCRFFIWTGQGLAPLYAHVREPYFQVGTDLLLLNRLPGAEHAFERGLAAGESRLDHLYWLGFVRLWRGDREGAEQAWMEQGAADDSLRWIAYLGAAHNALMDGDTLTALRHLITGIGHGIGRPEGHAMLGELMMMRHAKYGLLELEVATRLDPRDHASARHRVFGLAALQLDDSARRALHALRRSDPAAARDAALDSLERTLDARTPRAGDVVEL